MQRVTPRLVTDPVVRADVASRLVTDVALVERHVVADEHQMYLMHLKRPGRTQPAPFISALRAAGLEGMVTDRRRKRNIAEWDIPSLQRLVRWVLFAMQFHRKHRDLTREEVQVEAAACRLSDAIEPLMDTLRALANEPRALRTQNTEGKR